MKTAKTPVKRSRKKAARTPARSPKKAPEKPRKVTGTVLKIVNGKPTEKRLSAQDAFSDPAQAMEQVLYAEGGTAWVERRIEACTARLSSVSAKEVQIKVGQGALLLPDIDRLVPESLPLSGVSLRDRR